MVPQIGATFGAILLGGLGAAALSGIVVVQTFLYFVLFPRDPSRLKAIVAAVCTLDTVHSLLVFTSIWIYVITNFGDALIVRTIPIPLAMTGLITAILTFIVHCFFAHRIYKLSQQQLRFTAPILILAFLRICFAAVTTAGMVNFPNVTVFIPKFRWVLTFGLATSSLVDILITGFLTYLLRSLQKEIPAATRMDRVVGTVVMYTFETNLLTSTATLISMICWLAMPRNLIFLGFHFMIGKLYANSLLATLNARLHFHHRTQRGPSITIPSALFRSSGTPPAANDKYSSHRLDSDEMPTPTKLEITVGKAIEVELDERPPSQCRSFGTSLYHSMRANCELQLRVTPCPVHTSDS